MAEHVLWTAVCDAGPLIHLDELDCLDVLDGFARILIPDAVRSEVGRHRPRLAGADIPGAILGTPGRTRPDRLVAVGRLLSLHTGEMEALHLALVEPHGLLLTDDTAARLAARQLGVRAHGTVGLLIRSVRMGRRSKAEILEVLASIQERSSLHISRSLLVECMGALKAHPPPGGIPP